MRRIPGWFCLDRLDRRLDGGQNRLDLGLDLQDLLLPVLHINTAIGDANNLVSPLTCASSLLARGRQFLESSLQQASEGL